MPEGDTVLLSARQLHAALAGRPLTRAELRVPRHATADLVGMTVTEVVARGKHVLTRLDSGLTLHTHCKMDGSWRALCHRQEVDVRPYSQIPAILGNADVTAVATASP